MRQRTRTINALRGHLVEFGVIATQSRAHVARLALAVANPGSGLPEEARELGEILLSLIVGLKAKIGEFESKPRRSAYRTKRRSV